MFGFKRSMVQAVVFLTWALNYHTFGNLLIWWTLAILLTFVVVLTVTTYDHDYWKLRGVFSPPAWPIVGHILSVVTFREQGGMCFKKIYDTYRNERFLGTHQFYQRTLVIRDPELIKRVCVVDFQHFVDRGFFFNKDVDPLAGSVLFLRGNEWKKLRAKISPIFSPNKLRGMFPLIDNTANEFIVRVRELLTTTTVNANTKNNINRDEEKPSLRDINLALNNISDDISNLQTKYRDITDIDINRNDVQGNGNKHKSVHEYRIKHNDVQENANKLNGTDFCPSMLNGSQENVKIDAVRANTINLNGIQQNGIKYNAVQENSIKPKDVQENGIKHDAVQENDFKLNGLKVKGTKHTIYQENGIKHNSVQENGIKHSIVENRICVQQKIERYTKNNKMKEEEISATVDSEKLVGGYTADAIVPCAFGLKSGVMYNDKDPFAVALQAFYEMSVFNIFEKTMRQFWPAFVLFFRMRIIPKKTHDFFYNIVTSVLRARENGEQEKRGDFIDMMMSLRSDDDNITKTDDDVEITDMVISANAFIIFLGGFETTSSTLAFLCLELAAHPHVQRKMREEILQVVGKRGGDITYELLQELAYMEMVIQETLRLYPPFPSIQRLCTKDYTIPGTDVVVEKGTIVLFPTLAIQRDEQYFKHADQFLPERWLGKVAPPPGVYMPFGDGPRYCIGKRFAMIQMKCCLVRLLQHVHISPASASMLVERLTEPFAPEPRSPLTLHPADSRVKLTLL